MYRVSIGELPFITYISPISSRYETSTSVHIFGKNLSAKTMNVSSKDRDYPIQYLNVSKEGLVSNNVPFGFVDIPETNKIGVIDSRKNAQPIALPVVLNGCINVPGMKDNYSFAGKTDPANFYRGNGKETRFSFRFYNCYL